MEGNIYQRLNEVRRKVQYVQKDATVSTGKTGGYKAVTHDMVTAVVRPSLIEMGVMVVPSLVVDASMVPPPKADGSPSQMRYEARYSIAFINIDDPKDQFSVVVGAHANDSGDKAPGKALSYATKYAILKVLNLETGENEESRVKRDGLTDDDVAHYCDAIGECETLPELEAVYLEASAAARVAKDGSAMKTFIRKKDSRKGEIIAANPVPPL